jgi:uncharacterized RDD family membrane protein YckC
MTLATTHPLVQYAGFLRRLAAALLDAVLIGIIASALALTLFGFDNLTAWQSFSEEQPFEPLSLLLNQALPVIFTLAFWQLWQATPGKLLLDCRIVDARTLGKPSFGQFLLRYLGYLLSALALGLGFLWILFDQRRQGWHDKLARTLVIIDDESLKPLEQLR